MVLTSSILQSKLTPPRLADTTERDRLLPQMKEILTKRLAVVVAGAGYGKTTFVAQAAQYLKTDTVWYRLDASDRDFTIFLSYLISGIRNYHPRVGEKTLERMERAQVLHREMRAILRIFLHEVESALTHNLLVVLDDYHTVGNSGEIGDCLHFLLESMSLNLHVILISRTQPELPLSRFRAARDVLDIGEDDLAFTIEEIAQLYNRLFSIKLHEASWEILHARTGGWAAGLILLYHYSRGKSPGNIQEFLANLKGPHRFIANYLEENVYFMQKEAVKEFLCKTSILSRINADFCNRLLGITDSGKILRNLEEDHLFTFPFDEERHWYYYHHLFQDFLQTRLQQLERETVDDLHRRAAELWEKAGEDEEAIKHYLAASEPAVACRLLGRMGRRKFLKEGRLQLVSAFIREIPEDLRHSDPWIQYIQARVCELSGKPFAAIHNYNGARDRFIEQGQMQQAEVCLKGLGLNYFNIGDFPGAEKISREILDKHQVDPRLRFDILGFMIQITSHLGKMADADACLCAAQSMLPLFEDEARRAWIEFNQGFRHGCAGDYEAALAAGEKTKAYYSQPGYDLFLIMTYHLLAWINYYLFRFKDGLDYAREGLRLAEEEGVDDATRGWLQMDYALNAMGLGLYDDAFLAAGEAMRNFREIHCRWGQSYTSLVLQQLYARTGDYTKAEECVLAGLKAIEELDIPMDRGLLQASQAAMYLETGRPEEAKSLLAEAERVLQPSKLFLCQVYMYQARYFRENGAHEEAFHKALAGLSLAESHRYDYWIAAEKSWIVPLLVENYSRGAMEGYIRKLIQMMGRDAVKDLRRLERVSDHAVRKGAAILLADIESRYGNDLKVHCLGKFTICRGEEEIAKEKWTSGKAKMLLKILVHDRAKGFRSKDVLMEQLWPEEDPDITINRFHVALSSIRKTLEPDIRKGSASSYLLREGDAYQINLGENGTVDVDEFLDCLKQAKKATDPETALRLYLEAEALYGGDYLEEDPYADWCLEERDFLKDKYQAVLKQIMDCFEKKGHYESCIDYARKCLATDKYAEDIYRNLMRYYALTGNKGMITKTYQKCKDSLLHGLDVPPGPETDTLYRRLIAS